MRPVELARANEIVDRISEISESGGFLKPADVSTVGASSTAEALAALYLVTAETFQTAALSDSPKNQQILQEFIRAAGGTGMWIATLFRSDGQTHYSNDVEIEESVKKMETINSFVAFLRSIDPSSIDYWDRVYSRIGLPNPESAGRLNIKTPGKLPWWRRLLG